MGSFINLVDMARVVGGFATLVHKLYLSKWSTKREESKMSKILSTLFMNDPNTKPCDMLA